MPILEDFKVVNSIWKIEAQCPQCGRYTHYTFSLGGFAMDMDKTTSKARTARFHCYCGHKGFLNFK